MRHFGRFSNLDKCRPEAAGDLVSDIAVEYVGTDVPASFRDYMLFAGPVVLNKFVQFHDSSLNHSRGIPPESVGGGIFDSFFSQ